MGGGGAVCGGGGEDVPAAGAPQAAPRGEPRQHCRPLQVPRQAG